MQYSNYIVRVDSKLAYTLLKRGKRVLAANDLNAAMGGVEILLKGREDLSTFFFFEEKNEEAFGREYVYYYTAR